MDSQRCQALSAVAVVCVLGFILTVEADVNNYSNVSSSYGILSSNSSLPATARVNGDALDTCPNAAWRTWKLHVGPPEYDPFNWDRQQWRSYLVDYPLRSSALSLSFFLIGAIALIAALVWRTVQWCVGCGRCRHACSAGAEETDFLGDTKHTYLKSWICLLLALAAAMIVWGMLALNADLLSDFWTNVATLLDAIDGATGSLQALQATVETLPPMLQNLVNTVNNTAGAAQLRPLVQESVGFALSSKGALSSLLSSTTAMQTALDTAVLPGMAALAAQLGVALGPTARRARMLAQSSSSNSSSSGYRSLGDLLPALSTGVDSLAGMTDTRTGIQTDLQVLQAALAGVQREVVSSEVSPAIVALQAAVAAADVAQWRTDLEGLDAAMGAYNAVRSGNVLQSAASIADGIAAGASPLSSSAVTQTLNAATRLSQSLQAGPRMALQELMVRLQNISLNVVDIADWGVTLGNGTRYLVNDLTATLLGNLNDLVLISDTASPQPAAAATAYSFVKAALNSSNLVAQAASTAANLSSAAISAAAAAAAGPDPAAARSQIATTARAALDALVSPTFTLSTILARYIRAPTNVNLLALRAACANASAPVTAATATFAIPLDREKDLVAVAVALRANVKSLGSAASSLNVSLPAWYGSLRDVSKGSLASYTSGLSGLLGIVGQLPSADEAAAEVARAAEDGTAEVVRSTGDVQSGIADVLDKLNVTVSKLQKDILRPARDFQTDNEQRTKDAVHTAYPVWMSAWSLGALLLALLVVAVWLNWPAGLVAVGLLLLALITASQVVTSALAFGMGVLGDACDHAEVAAMNKLAQDKERPQLSAVLSYYFEGIPNSQEAMLQAAFGLNITDVRFRLQSANLTLSQHVKSTTRVRGLTLQLLNQLENTTVAMVPPLDEVLRRMSYESIHPMYWDIKNTACCDAAAAAYSQWCSITAAAALSFGALIAALYLLARIDFLSERPPGCCSCCACVCYRAHDRYKVDMEAASSIGEDQASDLEAVSKKIHWHRPRPRRHRLSSDDGSQREAVRKGKAAGHDDAHSLASSLTASAVVAPGSESADGNTAAGSSREVILISPSSQPSMTK